MKQFPMEEKLDEAARFHESMKQSPFFAIITEKDPSEIAYKGELSEEDASWIKIASW